MARRGDPAHALEAREARELKDKHPAVAIKTTSYGRRMVLVSHPALQVIDIIGTWQGEHRDAALTARYFGISEDDVQAVLRYYVDHADEVDQDLKAHLAAQQNYKSVPEQREAHARRRVAKERSG